MHFKKHTIAMAVLSVSAFGYSANTIAQEEAADETEVIQVSGIRGSLLTALNEKRSADNLVEVIQADDIGKLPDQNLAEVLENVTGIQITRTAGVGTGVQIRGTNANRVEINGVSTVGSGGGRNGIDFEDVSAAIIAGVEVTKSPQAKTIEGSVGGTINLKTIRPLALDDTLASVRVQAENSSLSTESAKPRLSATFGKNWESDLGKFGFVIAGSYIEQEAVSFRPRTDRDSLDNDGNLAIQFLTQEQENDDYETVNIATTLEWAPNENSKFYFDAIINEQEQSRDQYRAQASGVSALKNKDASKPDEYEVVNFGTKGDHSWPDFKAALKGSIGPDASEGFDNPNLRISSETGSRVTDTEVFVFGGEFQAEQFKISAEIATSSSDSVKPKFESTVNFINPKAPLVSRINYERTNGDGEVETGRVEVPFIDGIDSLEDAIASVDGGTSGIIYNDNATPFAYDLSGGTLSFGIDPNSAYTPTKEQLLDPKNYVFEKLEKGGDLQKNSEDSFRIDAEYYIDDSVITSIDVGYRFNKSSSEYTRINGSFSYGDMTRAANGELFKELLVPGPDNFGSADDRELYIKDFLWIDPDRSFSDPQGTVDIIYNALDTHYGSQSSRVNETPQNSSYYLVEEDTNAFYAQANFEYENIRGNFGLRHVSTEVQSSGYVDGVLTPIKGDYSLVLPRINVIADLTDDMVVRFGVGKDIRRPDFDSLKYGYNLNDNENTAVALGNPGLAPEEVQSFDLSWEWYFAEGSVVSVGYFTKLRTDIFGTKTFGAPLHPDPTTDSGTARSNDPSCPGGGFYNPNVVPSLLGNPDVKGLCVDYTQDSNDDVSTMQSGWEFAVQYDLAGFEDKLGWASGFGVMANYTMQEFNGGSIEDCTFSRGADVLGDDVCAERGLEDFSEDAYNFTLYYEKYGLSARMRYTWRDAFTSTDFGGGSSTSSTLSFPVVTSARGQLNASVTYDITEQLNVGVEAVNLTEQGVEQYCVNDGALLCFVGLPDRRVTAGATYKF
ncbi:TonB-dependent receptor [Saccharobesus litoralis]|uniref:TonB-dependent receptor n=1 Tax=Saccharobesus litoralis TaxID=2172099 RepID=A0A2S0VLH4_9ALTE|nr:TonB-dependent receptor [Saccharobesus litoralis]AWB65051.1 TonB-dependent receptor [Saccharobesus litoralis]